mmetsp:Transcript_48552/g.113869  ORF Transcript_48552/g.113869 Transcript_48552/m.113869 type:complete len:247 (+) Transcript_48552:88-828(+)
MYLPSRCLASLAGRTGTSCGSRGFATLKKISELPSVKKKETGYFGVEWGMGRKPTEFNAFDVELPKEPFDPKPYKLHVRKYPGIASGLGAEYFYREDQRSPLTYYHVRCPAAGDTVLVGATDSRAIQARTIDNYVKERTRGFAVQLILEGRGVKAYFEPKYPFLKVRLGVGAKVRDLTEYVTRDPDIMVSVSKAGDLMVVHGPNKERVGTLAFRLYKKMTPILMPYTGKGAHFAFHPVKRKPMRKK